MTTRVAPTETQTAVNTLSNSPVGKIIVVDDEPELKNILVAALSAQGFEVTGCSSAQQALAELRQKEFDLLLTDLMMPEMDGIALLEAAAKIDPQLIGIMMTGQGTIQTAVDAMKLGAFDYVLKPFRLQTVLPVLTRAINTRRLRMENLQLRETVAIYSLCQTISFTLDPQTVLSKLADAALQQSDADEVSILLPTSDGKELYVAAVRGEKRERLLGERIPLQQSISSWVARERLPLILNGEIQDERFVALWPRSEIRSAVSVPMQVANKLVGIINLNVINRLRPFTLGQMKALTILASTAAAALESASLFAQVQQAETNYRSIFENAVEGIFRSTADRRFITVNPALAQILGYESPEEVISSFSDIGQQLYVDPTRSAEVARSLKQRGVVHGFEVEAYRKDGRKIWISLNIRIVRDEKGVEICREGTLADITERKRAEEERAQLTAEIERQRDRLNTVVTNIPGMVWEAWGEPNAAQQRTDYTSQYVETMLGYSVEEWLGTPNIWLSIVHPDDKERAASEVAETFAHGKGGALEFRWIAKDGHVVWAGTQYVVIRDADGLPLGLRGVTIDITERKRAEEALRQSESKLVEAQRLAHIGSWNWDLQQNVMTWSDEHYRIFGVERGDIDVNCDEEVFDFIHPEDRELVRSMVAKTRETKEPFNFYYRIVRRAGEERIIQSSGRVEVDGPGQPVRMFGTAQDVTERRRIEQKLTQSEERYRLLFQSNPLPMWLYDLETLAFLTVNDAAIRHYGYSHEEFLSMTIKDIRPSEDVPALLENVSRVSGGIDEAGSWRHQKKDGQIINVEITSHKLTFAGRRAELVLANDVTERRRVEEMRTRRATQVALRGDVSAALAESEAPLRRTLERCSEAMVQHLGAAFARIWTLNQEENVLELQASAGEYTHIDGPHARVPVGKFKIGLIAEERQPHITNDVQTDPRVSDKEWAKREGMIAFAGYPLVVEGRLVGVMAMFSRQRLAEDTLDTLASVAEIISQGIERKRAEEALSKSQELYRNLVENAHDIIYSHDLDGNYTSMNQAGQQITGYTREEALTLNISQMVAREDLPKAREMLTRKLAGETVTAYEMEIIAKDGRRVEVEVNTKAVYDDGVPVGVQGIARDITERRRAEEALRESEARKRAILESSMDCIVTMDHDGRVVDWNPAAEKTFGYTREEAIGAEMDLLIIPQRFREKHRQGLARYLATGKAQVIGQRLELSAERRDGTEFPIELTITQIESKGAPMFTGYLRDITERKKAEGRLFAQYAVTRALAESNTLDEGAVRILQAVCESLGWEYGSLWTVDSKANLLRCSQVWQALGSEVDEFERVSRESVFSPGVGLPGKVWNDRQSVWIADVVHDNNFPRSAAAAAVGLQSACGFPIRFRSDILGVVEFLSRSIREPDPDLLAMMGTIGSQIGQFIERRRVEEALSESEDQLRQSQKLEAVGQLAGGVAHDFNNLLTVIGGYSSIVLGKLPPESPHRSSIEEIKKASDRASALTRQLLAFSRKQILQPKVLDLNLVVTDLEKMVRRLIGEDIDLLTLTGPLLGRVKADPGQLEQVLLNLIVNARDAMPKGGKLTIETGNVMLSEEYAERHAALPGRYVLLAVSDTGCGMDANIQPRVFEPFFTTKASGKGTGLGLATVYGIVKQSGGNIWVYSEVGRGSTFKIYLPRVDDISEDEEVVAAKSIPQGTETVLLVEDEDQVRAILTHILEDQGYQVLSASNGEEALAISEDLQRDIKLMVTDVVMPQMSGRELAERVLRIRPSLPVLFMSGYTDDAIVRHGLLDEKLNFIQKPFDSVSVARKVREVLDAHS